MAPITIPQLIIIFQDKKKMHKLKKTKLRIEDHVKYKCKLMRKQILYRAKQTIKVNLKQVNQIFQFKNLKKTKIFSWTKQIKMPGRNSY